MTAADIIRILGLTPHPEGGHYRETVQMRLAASKRRHKGAISEGLKTGLRVGIRPRPPQGGFCIVHSVNQAFWRGVGARTWGLPSSMRRPDNMGSRSMNVSKKQQIITGALMTTGMAFALSGFFSLIHVGIKSELPVIWGTNFLMGWPVGFVVSATIAGPVQRLAGRLSRR